VLPTPKELLAAAVRAIRRMLREHFTGTAAELAYYGLLSTVPCIAAFVGILGLLGSDPETTEAITKIVREGASTEAGEAAKEAARHVVERDGAAGIALGAGLVTTLWVASIYLAAFRRAAYRVHGADPGPAWRVRPLQIGLTFLGLVGLALMAIVLAVTKRLVREVGQAVGAEDATVAIWSLARWPLVLFLVVLVTAGLYNLAPRKGRSGGRALSVGSVVAVLVWLLSSAGFEVWVENFADYDATYGALAGAVAFAVWLWISNLALLFGMVLDLELRSASEGGTPPARPTSAAAGGPS
jgi:membrane protein